MVFHLQKNCFQAISIWLQAKSAVIFSCDWESSGKFASCVWSLLVKLVVSSCGKIDGSTLLSDLFTCPRDWLQTLRSRLATPRRGFWTAPLDLSALYLGLVRRWWNLVLEIFDPDRMAWIGHETLCKICNRYLPQRNFNLMKSKMNPKIKMNYEITDWLRLWIHLSHYRRRRAISIQKLQTAWEGPVTILPATRLMPPKGNDPGTWATPWWGAILPSFTMTTEC